MLKWAESVLYVLRCGYIFIFENVLFQIPGLSNKYYMVLLISCDFFTQNSFVSKMNALTLNNIFECKSCFAGCCLNKTKN